MVNDVAVEDTANLCDDLVSLEAAPQLVRGPRCGVRQILDRLPDTERETLERVIGDDRISAAAIARTLQSHGHQIGHNSIVRHRRGYGQGGCACELR